MTGLLLGAAVGLGAWLVVTGLRHHRPTLEERLAPHLGGAQHVPTGSLLRRLADPFVADAAAAVDRWLGGTAGVRRRLERAGSTTSVNAFRVEQLVWGGAAGASVAALLLLRLAAGAPPGPVPAVAGVGTAVVAGVLCRDRWLSHQVARREDRVLAELPAVAELLALAVAAGEGPAAALERVASRSRGDLSSELRTALADVRTGTPLVVALERVSARTGLPAVARFVDGVAVAVERGTPLADVLRAQAVDVREAGKRRLLETAGRREIAMMLPVVFLVLPTAVVFALWPGFYGLSLVAG